MTVSLSYYSCLLLLLLHLPSLQKTKTNTLLYSTLSLSLLKSFLKERERVNLRERRKEKVCTVCGEGRRGGYWGFAETVMLLSHCLICRLCKPSTSVSFNPVLVLYQFYHKVTIKAKIKFTDKITETAEHKTPFPLSLPLSQIFYSFYYLPFIL